LVAGVHDALADPAYVDVASFALDRSQTLTWQGPNGNVQSCGEW
jgi:hypothetical protein